MLTILFTFATKSVTSQNKHSNKIKIGIGAEMFVSGNGHGIFYSSQIIFSRERISLSVGPCIQKRFKEISNAKVSVSYQLTGTKKDIFDSRTFGSDEIDLLQLRAFGYVNYIHQNHLSYNAAMLETTTQTINSNDWNSVIPILNMF